jgi:hypothetical protein
MTVRLVYMPFAQGSLVLMYTRDARDAEIESGYSLR